MESILSSQKSLEKILYLHGVFLPLGNSGISALKHMRAHTWTRLKPRCPEDSELGSACDERGAAV